jgi:sulfur carrier protein ThiS
MGRVDEAVVGHADGGGAGDRRQSEHRRPRQSEREEVYRPEGETDEGGHRGHDEEGDGVDGGPVAVPEAHGGLYGSTAKTRAPGIRRFRAVRPLRPPMPTVRAEVVGEGTRELRLDADATYADLLAALDFSPHEATVLVDDTPVPEDRTVDADRVRVLRLVKGGTAVSVRPARPDDHLDVMRIVDGAMLSADAATIRDRIDDGAVLVATVDSGSPVGALVHDGDRVTAVATRRRYRDRGVGTALVTAALERRGRLVAEFDPDVRPFYESLGFDVEAVEDGRLRGRLDA